jgi:hypothetical protein
MRYPFARPFAFSIAPLLVALTYGDCAMSADISMSCHPGLRVDMAMAETICMEFKDLLVKNYPQHSFDNGTQTPGIALTVTKANQRSLGLEVIWTASGGAGTAGIPLSTAFFDRDSDTHLRRLFYETFLLENPLPF